jgi:hypothetical protein
MLPDNVAIDDLIRWRARQQDVVIREYLKFIDAGYIIDAKDWTILLDGDGIETYLHRGNAAFSVRMQFFEDGGAFKVNIRIDKLFGNHATPRTESPK